MIAYKLLPSRFERNTKLLSRISTTHFPARFKYRPTTHPKMSTSERRTPISPRSTSTPSLILSRPVHSHRPTYHWCRMRIPSLDQTAPMRTTSNCQMKWSRSSLIRISKTRTQQMPSRFGGLLIHTATVVEERGGRKTFLWSRIGISSIARRINLRKSESRTKNY
jgi:hypothetical protein